MLKSSQVALAWVNRPSRRLVRRWCLAAAAISLLYSALASALGLGEITLHSALDQPFNADIELLETAGLTADDIHVGLASQDAFSRAGVDRLFFLNDLHFTTVINGSHGVVHVVSRKPVIEPYLIFLVRLARPNGDLVHAYTLLIDPPESSQGRTASRGRWIEPKGNNPVEARMPVAPPQAVQGNHYTVVSGDNLGAIARRFHDSGSKSSANDLSRGIQALNPQAFSNGSGTRLKIGQSLLLPDTVVLARSPEGPVSPSTALPAADSSASEPIVSAEQKTAELLAADVIENQQLTKSVGDLKVELQGLQNQITGKDKQVNDLQTALAELKAKPVAPSAAVPVVGTSPSRTAPEDNSFISIPLLIGALLLLLLLLGLAYAVRRKRLQSLPPAQAAYVTPDPTTPSPMTARVVESPAVTVVPVAPALVASSASNQRLAGVATDALDGASIYIAYGRFSEALGILREASLKQPQRTDLRLRILELLAEQGDVDGFALEEHALLDDGVSADSVQEVRARYPQFFIKPELTEVPLPEVPAEIVLKPGLAAPQSDSRFIEPQTPVPIAQPVDEFHLNLDDLSMDAGWDLVDPFEPPPAMRSKSVTDDAVEIEPEFSSNLTEFPEVLEIPNELFLSDFAEPEPNIQSNNDSLDDDFLDGFINDSKEFDLLDLANDEPLSKLNQAQVLIDDGELDDARALLQEVIKGGDEEHQRTAQNLLARIS
ncbi:FimV/HubP family polar landmark protein [Pseudomonas sp. 10B1]|uniref:FimV/HubP family polar landmark protein n=2 Tax=Pseudomonadota TaxID=1224 RepID=UPI002AB3786B|nr:MULTISPECIES: FimV/HubP family polar landmark protein [unclassified Pseudomonas]MDY7561133.1 FimV/HubP family polar landmark protein [Pseudomonas sp. AB6]MEA9979616.1 FimV/HubP family polar landmark protein [Pseudomonas sp. RTS4]MEA9997253.1 FimV/HubP family polar landmark protein [Pseudomonas sp. AA4]MEB0089030.1 FimV/HubP family polar landmark protein [Pseudomonas sp. RTI1]MEB0128296.1 FimV/HubP family polar landmark protein [Pseudomonas sp. CCC1.2]